MNFSLFARRLVSSLPALRIRVASSSVLTSPAFAATRRTFFTTRRIQLAAAAPASASTTAAKKVTKKPAAKKSAPKKAAAKKASPKKTKAKPGPKSKSKKVAEKPATPKKVPKSEQPPSRPPNAYILFFKKRLTQGQTDKAKSLADTQAVAKQTSAAWKSFTLADKQPYYDEAEVLRKQYEDKLHEYWKNAPSGIIRKINARRRSDGKKMIHRPRQEVAHPRPMVPFFRFAQDFRQTHDGKAIQDAGMTSAGRPAINVAREAGSRWRAMSDSEKAPYVERYQTELADWTANHSKSASAGA